MNDTISKTINIKDGFDQIYVDYYFRMFRFAKAYTLSDEDAENVVQDVFLFLWEKREVINIRVSLISYLFSLVKSHCLDYLRHQIVADEYKQEMKVKLSALEQLNCIFASEEDIENVIKNAVNKLPERCRIIFLKSRVEGKKYHDIAEELNISVNTVESQMSIALRKLRVELRDYLPLYLFLIANFINNLTHLPSQK